MICTRIEKEGVRYDIEQFAYPLNGPPPQRSGDMPMVLLQKVKVSELAGKDQKRADLKMTHHLELATETGDLVVHEEGKTWICEETQNRGLTLELEGTGLDAPVEFPRW